MTTKLKKVIRKNVMWRCNHLRICFTATAVHQEGVRQGSQQLQLQRVAADRHRRRQHHHRRRNRRRHPHDAPSTGTARPACHRRRPVGVARGAPRHQHADERLRESDVQVLRTGSQRIDLSHTTFGRREPIRNWEIDQTLNDFGTHSLVPTVL